MAPELTLDLDAIARTCERFHVERLRVFGSALTDRFDPEHSDVDLLVEYRPTAERTFRDFVALQDESERIIGYPVDLVEPQNLRNPFIVRTVFSNTRELYAA